MTPLRPVVRPMFEAEARLLKWAVIRQRRFLLRMAPLITLTVGLILFGGLWGLSVLATRADKTGPSWRASGLIWLGIGTGISLWSYRDLRRYAATYKGNFGSALKRNRAVEVRIRSEAVVLLDWKKEKPVYAFEMGGKQIAFVSWRKAHSSARFPNADFSLVDLVAESGRPAVGLIEKRGKKMNPVRMIPADTVKNLVIPEHLETMRGELSQIERLLAR
jgi:hypothetical protein